MNEKPQGTRADEQTDLLEQIISQGLEKMGPPAQTMTEEAAPAEAAPHASPQEDSGETAPPANRKNRRSSVYLYLVILFGAAFLLLLLAYFIQQRNSSREELLAQIGELEEQNAALNGKIDRLQSDLALWQERYEEKDGELTDLWNQIEAEREEMYSYSSFLQLERYYLENDYKSCAAILVLQLMGQYAYHTPSGFEQRYEEIVRAVIGAGILKENYEQHPEDYEDLLDAYFEKAGVSVQWTGASQWTDGVTWVITDVDHNRRWIITGC